MSGEKIAFSPCETEIKKAGGNRRPESCRPDLEDLAGAAGIQLAQAVRGILHLGGKDHRRDDIRLVGSFHIERVDIAFKDAAVDFTFLAGKAGNIRRQAVHV